MSDPYRDNYAALEARVRALIDAELAAAKVLLSEGVRQGLLEVARYDIPVLEVAGRAAKLRWAYEPNERCLRAAIQVLSGIRHAPLQIQLLLARQA